MFADLYMTNINNIIMQLRDIRASIFYCATGALSHFKHFEEGLVKDGAMAQPHPDMTETQSSRLISV
jgi:hypothetical protein